jgi:pseudouridine 5'-phosphatase
MTIRAVAFDMDGLMFNSEDVYTQVGSRLMQRRGHEFTPELKNSMMGLPPRPSFEVMINWYNLSDSWETLYEESEEIFLELMGEMLEPMPGLTTLLDSLEAAGIPKAVATSSSAEVAGAVLSSTKVLSRLEFVLTCKDIVHGKPDPEIYKLAADRFGVKAKEMMVLEDSHFGTRAGAAAGAFIVAVPNHHTEGHDFSMARLTADSLEDPKIYEALGINKVG